MPLLNESNHDEWSVTFGFYLDSLATTSAYSAGLCGATWAVKVGAVAI
jgi:hypothetical protein